METALKEKIHTRKLNLADRLRDELMHIAQSSAEIWALTEKLDSVLRSSLKRIPACKMLFAVECHGIQISSNILANGDINTLARGQNLSDRPYMLNNNPNELFSLSPVYISRTDRKPSITAMHKVFDANGVRLGCIAADFNIDDLPEENIELFKSYYWRQIKGDPAIRKNLFQQKRVDSPMDRQLDQVNDIINNLICKRGIFHAKLHYSSSRATLWLHENPYEYRLHVLDEIIDPDVCLAYPSRPYPKEARVAEQDVIKVFKRFKELRNADDTIYLRSGSINIMNAMAGLNFSCDGSHYMPVDEFLNKSDSFWFGY